MQNQTAPVAFTTARVPNGPPQNVYEQGGYRWTEGGNGVKADASCVLATCEEPLALEVWVADRAKPDFATADTKFFEEVKRALELRCKAPVFPRHIIAVVDGFLPDGDEMWTGAGGGCVKKVTIQAHGHYAKLGGRADLLVAMVKDRFREVGEAIGVELKSAEE